MTEAGIHHRMESCVAHNCALLPESQFTIQSAKSKCVRDRIIKVLRKYNYSQLTSHISILKREQKYPFLWTMPASCCKTVSKAKKVNSIRSSAASTFHPTTVDAEFGKGVLLVQTTLDCKKKIFQCETNNFKVPFLSTFTLYIFVLES